MTLGRSIALGLSFGLVFLVGWLAMQWGYVSIDPEAIAQQVRAAGPVGPAVLFALFVLQCVVAPLPSEPVMMAAGFVYGPLPGFILSWLGVVVGAIACFVLARRFGRPFVERFVSPERLSAIDAYITGRGLAKAFLTILFIRLFAFASFDIVSYGCGLLQLPFRWFVVASALGVVPKVFAFTYLGANVTDRPGWLQIMILVGTFGAILLVPWLLRLRQRKPAAEI